TIRMRRRGRRSTHTPANRLSSRNGANSTAESKPICDAEAFSTRAAVSGIASWLISLPKREIVCPVHSLTKSGWRHNPIRRYCVGSAHVRCYAPEGAPPPQPPDARRDGQLMNERVLIIPGLNGHPGLLMHAAPNLFPRWQHLCFNHHLDLGAGGVAGRGARALQSFGEDHDPAFICGESFGGTIALTLAHSHPERVKGLILFSTFGFHPSMLARRASAGLAVWSFLGYRATIPVYKAAR